MSEVRQTDPDTGGQKGCKPERLELVPQQALLELARVYAFGAAKYSDWNYLKGYKWSLSIGAMQRHLLAWSLGESKDPESGLSHLAHVAWHAFTLMTYQLYGLGKDDRIGAWLEGNIQDDHGLFADARPMAATGGTGQKGCVGTTTTGSCSKTTQSTESGSLPANGDGPSETLDIGGRPSTKQLTSDSSHNTQNNGEPIALSS